MFKLIPFPFFVFGSLAKRIDNPLVVHRITSPGGGFCTLVGEKGESVVIHAEDEKMLDVPQAMSWGSCGPV